MKSKSKNFENNLAAHHKRREVHPFDRLFAVVLRIPSVGLILLLLLIIFFLLQQAQPAIYKFGFQFITSFVWDPVQDVYGVVPVIYGTVLSSLIAILIATPISIGAALVITEIAPKTLGVLIGFLVELLAAIPSVVYGLWGIFVLTPLLRVSVEPWLGGYFGFLPLFQGPSYGVGMLAAGIILAIMITPTISSISREVFSAIPQAQREAALALGATHWEMIQLAILKSSKRGIFGAVILGLGRALGETMAVTMVIGNKHEISASLFSPASTMASIIANEYSEATTDLHVSALVGVGLTLFMVTLIINGLARLLVARGFRWSVK